MSASNSVMFSNLDKIAVNEVVKFEIIDANGEPATVGIERVPLTSRSLSATSSSTDWKVWYTGVSINAHFYMTVTNNIVTNVYDPWIMVIGGTYDNETLTKTSTYGKLTFKVLGYGGIFAATCWLKGTVTGSNNNITVSWQM